MGSRLVEPSISLRITTAIRLSLRLVTTAPALSFEGQSQSYREGPRDRRKKQIGWAKLKFSHLCFRPGFSTANEITEVSGRGVGLDVVQNVLHRLKGSVDIETRVGRGTTFRLKLPLTLAIIKALLFRVEHRLYAIPLNAVAEIARARESDIHQVHNFEVLQLRDRVSTAGSPGTRARQLERRVREKSLYW